MAGGKVGERMEGEEVRVADTLIARDKHFFLQLLSWVRLRPLRLVDCNVWPRRYLSAAESGRYRLQR